MRSNVERTSQLSIGRTLFAGIGMRRLFVFLLRQIFKRMMQCVGCPDLLSKQ